jgi:uncharacterized protein YbjT (DUF2867 family)
MEPILVTGGTGTLGRAVVREFGKDGRELRVLSRRSAPLNEAEGYRRITGDLRTGSGVAAAVEGAGLIVHCATTNGRGDIAAARHLMAAARSTGAGPRVLFVSIVGVDVIPIPYYRAKLAAEQVVAESGLPWTVLRVTQFHDLVARLFAAQRRLPLTLTARRIRVQPIDVRDAARRVVELAEGGPVGRADDTGGPQVQDMRELAHLYNEAHGRRRPVVDLVIPGRIARGYAAGGNLAPGNAVGDITFADFMAEQTVRGAR